MTLRWTPEQYEAWRERQSLQVPKRGRTNTVTLPWPPSILSPNARTHWAAKSRAAKEYRATCARLCLEAGLVAPKSERIVLMVDFYPPDKRRRDMDNMVASCKSGFDGIADALGIDDSRFILTPMRVDQVAGWVIVTLLETPKEKACTDNRQ